MHASFEGGTLAFDHVSGEEQPYAAFLADLVQPGGYGHVTGGAEFGVPVARDVSRESVSLLLRSAGVEC